MVPELNDHLLLLIFANLDLFFLHKVAECSRRFRMLAQRTFSHELDGQLDIYTYSLNHGMLPIFGPFAKHITFGNCDYESSLNSFVIWRHFDITILLSITIDPFITHMKDIGNVFQDNVRFDKLKNLDLYTDDHYYSGRWTATAKTFAFNFRQWCPQLISLKMNKFVIIGNDENQLPRTLKKLDIECQFDDSDRVNTLKSLLRLNANIVDIRLREFAWLFHPNWILSYLTECGLHTTLESFAFQNEEQMWNFKWHPYYEYLFCKLESTLSMFQQLENLEFMFYGNLCSQQNIQLFKSLAKLKCLRIPMIEAETFDDMQDIFLENFIINVPTNLTQLILYDVDISSKDWRKFVAAMPASCDCQKHKTERPKVNEFRHREY